MLVLSQQLLLSALQCHICMRAQASIEAFVLFLLYGVYDHIHLIVQARLPGYLCRGLRRHIGRIQRRPGQRAQIQPPSDSGDEHDCQGKDEGGHPLPIGIDHARPPTCLICSSVASSMWGCSSVPDTTRYSVAGHQYSPLSVSLPSTCTTQVSTPGRAPKIVVELTESVRPLSSAANCAASPAMR